MQGGCNCLDQCGIAVETKVTSKNDLVCVGGGEAEGGSCLIGQQERCLSSPGYSFLTLASLRVLTL